MSGDQGQAQGDPSSNEISLSLWKRRMRLQLSVEDLAEKAGLTARIVLSAERGVRHLAAVYIEQIQIALDLAEREAAAVASAPAEPR